MAGRRDSPTAPYYRNRGYKATVWFDEPLTPEKIQAINLATHSVNQGLVIRLCAYLEYCRVYKPNINHSLDGHNEIDILRRLRNCFAHTSGYYNPSDTEQKTLYDRIIRHFNLNKDDFPESDYLFPIPIDTMLTPLVEGCKEYVKALSRA